MTRTTLMIWRHSTWETQVCHKSLGQVLLVPPREITDMHIRTPVCRAAQIHQSKNIIRVKRRALIHLSASETDHAEHEATHESDSLNELEPLERSAFDQEQFNEDNPKTSTHKSILDAIMSSSEEEDEHTREKLHPKGRAVSKKRNKVTFCEFFTSSSEEDESNCDLKRFVTDEPYTRIKCKSVNQEHEVGQGVTTFGVSKRGRPRKSYNIRKIITNSTASHDENVDSGEDYKNYNKVVIDPSEVSSDHCVSKRFQSRVKTGNRSRTENER